jgi:hypothetical protein
MNEIVKSVLIALNSKRPKDCRDILVKQTLCMKKKRSTTKCNVFDLALREGQKFPSSPDHCLNGIIEN